MVAPAANLDGKKLTQEELLRVILAECETVTTKLPHYLEAATMKFTLERIQALIRTHGDLEDSKQLSSGSHS